MGSTEHLSVLLFNISCGSLPRGLTKEEKNVARTGIANDQLTGVRQVIKSIYTSDTPNLFVFAQDGLEGEKLQELKKSLSEIEIDFDFNVNVVGQPQICGNKNADILQDRRQGSSALSADFVDPLAHFDPFIFLERLTAYTIILNEQKILLVSWHGPNTGFTLGMKSRLFRLLILSVAEVQKKTEADIVVLGGDFNMTLQEALDADQTYKVLDTPTRKGRFVPDTDFDNSIDFVVVWPRDRVEVDDDFPMVLKFEFDNFPALNTYPNSKIVPFDGERRCSILQPFDHARVLYRFKIKPRAVSGALESPHSTDDVDSVTESMAHLQATLSSHTVKDASTQTQ